MLAADVDIEFRKAMDIEACEFLAGEELVEVVPNFTSGAIQFIGGDAGPFEAGLPSEVPLWVATNLRKRMKCVVKIPDWLSVEKLKEILLAETEAVDSLLQLPSQHFFEMAHILVRECKEDFQDGDQAKTLVQDIWDKREAKLRTTTLRYLKQTSHTYAHMDNTQQLEITNLRQPLLAALKQTDNLLQNKHYIQQK